MLAPRATSAPVHWATASRAPTPRSCRAKSFEVGRLGYIVWILKHEIIPSILVTHERVKIGPHANSPIGNEYGISIPSPGSTEEGAPPLGRPRRGNADPVFV